MHRDTSDGNVWMWIPATEPQHAVPEWFTEQGRALFNRFPVGLNWFPRRPGMTGDFGLAMDMLKEDSAANSVITTVHLMSSLHLLPC